MSGDVYSRADGGRHGSSSRSHFASRDDRRDRDRRRDGRRSRSPQPRGSRREYEVDTYSSSRDYREREREDTYARRERRDDRGWDRDSHSRRDPRRDDDRGHGRRDRELFDDRGGRGRRDRDDRDGFGGGRGRKKSATPPFKKREPTPDLTGVVSILQRQRRMTQWDIKPVGYDNITAEQAKLSGMFPLPGAPRAAPMDPSRLKAFMDQPAGSASSSVLRPTNAKQAKRLVVYNFPPAANGDILLEFFNLQMNGVNLVSGHDPCVSAQISPDHTYALLEFKTAEDATYALALDGISMEDSGAMDISHGSSGLEIRRPKDYIAPTPGDEAEQVEGQVSDIVKDSPNKISVTNIPVYLDGAQIQELLVSFGPLKSFVLAQDNGTDQSRGIAFCEYADANVTKLAVEGLDGMELGDGKLKVALASIGITQAPGLENGVSAMTMLAGSNIKDNRPDMSRVIMLMNMVTAEELMDKNEYQEIRDDIEEECSKFGKIEELKIPRPQGPRVAPGVGKVFIKYERTEFAQKALKALAGRKFSDRTVVVTFFSEENFDVNAW